MKIGILGGTFNPPHIGHLILAEQVKDNLGLGKVFFVPTNIPPHKEMDILVNSKHRVNMVALSIKDNDCFELLDYEVKREGVSYTIDTIREIKKYFPQDDLHLIIGSELANEFHTWKNFEEIKSLVKIVVGQRKNKPFYGEEFIIVDIVEIEISSSYIRERLKQGKSIKYFVKDEVEDYIRRHNLYR